MFYFQFSSVEEGVGRDDGIQLFSHLPITITNIGLRRI